MSSFNKVIIAGNLTRDPELRQLNNNQSVCRLGLASNRQYKNRTSGDMVQEVCYVDIDVWGPQAETCNQYLQKGKPVLVEGRLKFDSWKDNEGQTRSKHSIVADRVIFLNSSQDSDSYQPSESVKMDKEIQNQIDKAQKSRSADQSKAKKVVASKVASEKYEAEVDDIPEINFQDEPPFQDDLPF